MLSNRIPRPDVLVLFALVLSVLTSAVFSQSPALTRSSDESSRRETWFGWIETPKQHLRTIVRVERNEQGKAIAGALVSPDQTLTEIPLSSLELNPNGAWTFVVTNPESSQSAATYSGTQMTADQVEGDFEKEGEKVSLKLRKVDSMPTETRNNLGADSVWIGALDLVVRKLDIRIRVYSKPPFASEDNPRFLFDSLTQNVPGVPAQFTSGADGKSTLEMKSIGAKFSGVLNEAGDELDGRFIQGAVPLKLVLKLQPKEVQKPIADETNKEMRPSEKSDSLGKKGSEPNSPLLFEGESVPSISKTQSVSTEFYDEVPFEVTYGAKPRKAKEPTSSQLGTKLAGTFTIPKRKNKEQTQAFPAVVMVTGSGPQDRNETIGRHKPFEVIAHYLAENGIASLRYDDRGVGESTGDFFNATSEDFARDAIAVWKHAKTLIDIDPMRIGILGHSEGGLVGPIAAAWEPQIAFLILIAPPGINGSEILKSQIERISELQGMSEADRKATMALQGRLQDIASGYFSDESNMRRDIQAAIRQNWEGLKSIAQSQDPSVNLDDMKKQLSEQIEGQFQQLRTPWFRFFLTYDPAPNWMIIRCPTLAMWGSNDVQVLPELNRDKLKVAVERNSVLDAQLTIIPGLNHLMQMSKTGLPEEYEGIDETISPLALNAIRVWAKAHGFSDK